MVEYKGNGGEAPRILVRDEHKNRIVMWSGFILCSFFTYLMTLYQLHCLHSAEWQDYFV